ncbi:MAG TPA: hypothetical protein VFN72_13610 [Solirubrobacterales bacterium]|nr:hypothetical protein [Solirubrobacterales bacterium]
MLGTEAAQKLSEHEAQLAGGLRHVDQMNPRHDPKSRDWRNSMRVEWHGQSAFTLTADGTKVFIDPFGDMSWLIREHPGMKFDYPPIQAEDVDLLLRQEDALGALKRDCLLGAKLGLAEVAEVGDSDAVETEDEDRLGTPAFPRRRHARTRSRSPPRPVTRACPRSTAVPSDRRRPHRFRCDRRARA